VERRLRSDLDLDLRSEIERRRPRSGWEETWRRIKGVGQYSEKAVIQEILDRRSAATQALVRAGAGYWSRPYGEPEWITIPAGEFWMGGDKNEDERPVQRVHLDGYLIARVPVTNAQYLLFVQATGHPAPGHWQDNRPPKGLDSHPVVRMTWDDAMAYCRWLSQSTGKAITLPSEAEWEKAARGDKDKREYPWGDAFDATKCNGLPLGLGGTTPVGIFPEGASLYGCLDMSGNVWEWTRSLYQPYPYPSGKQERAEQENISSRNSRVLRGGAFANDDELNLRCAARLRYNPYRRYDVIGFRVFASPLRSVPEGLPLASVPL
jgi:formylglycine-generating enzyme required for sulfatase activity